MDETRAELSTKEINDLPDSDFAYIEPGGKKDDEGKTVPRSLRHYPIHDEAHARNALQRARAQIEEGGEGGEIAEKAMPKIMAACKKFGIDVSEQKSAALEAQERDDPTPEDEDVSAALAKAKIALAKAKAAQLTDPDNNTDPDDEAVMAKITAAEAAIDGAIAAQAKDGAPDKAEKKSAIPAVPKKGTLAQTVENAVPVVYRLAWDPSQPLPFTGYASTTDQPYSVSDWLGEYEETIRFGAFDTTLQQRGNVPLLYDHDGEPLAATQSGTSILTPDSRGLRNEASLNPERRSTIEGIRRGDINKMSFSFRAIGEEWNETYTKRSVTELALYDTSIVTYPANPNTSAEMKSAAIDFLGREGMSVIQSARSALPLVMQRSAFEVTEPLYEAAIRAVASLDGYLCKRFLFGRDIYMGRARTLRVASVLEQVRKGAVLSGKNKALLQSALDALAGAQKNHDKTSAAHQTASEAIGSVIDNATSADGADGGPNTTGNPINPADGAGPRSAPSSVLKAQRELELLKLR